MRYGYELDIIKKTDINHICQTKWYIFGTNISHFLLSQKFRDIILEYEEEGI